MKFLIASGLALAGASNECGQCWEMGENGECNPAPGTISTICGSNSITMSIAACVLDGSHVYSDVYVGDDQTNSGCKLSTGDDDTYQLTHGLEECGMTVTYNDADGSINFLNKMTVPGIMDTTGMILTTQPIEWTFGCNFESSYDIRADEMTMDSSARTGEFVDTGRFDLSLDFYRSDKYETTTDGSSQVGSAVNFGITFNGGLPMNSLIFAPIACVVTNTANTDQVFSLWNAADPDMCDLSSHPVDFQISQKPTDDRAFYGLTYTGFGFDSVASETQTLQLKCIVDVCLADSEDSTCSSGCFETVLSEWSTWTGCSGSCGVGGTRSRQRYCVQACDDVQDSELFQIEECVLDACPPDFDQWSSWGLCSATCDGGSRLRTRQCIEWCDDVQSDDLQQAEDCGMDACPRVTITVFSGDVIDGIDIDGELFGNSTGGEDSFTMDSDEYVTSITFGYHTHSWFSTGSRYGDHLCKLTIQTNKSNYGPWASHHNMCGSVSSVYIPSTLENYLVDNSSESWMGFILVRKV